MLCCVLVTSIHGRDRGDPFDTSSERMAAPAENDYLGGLSPEEWLVLFPRPVVAVCDVGDTRDAFPDPAEELRAQSPLTTDSVLRIVSSEPLLLNVTRVNLWAAPWSSRSALRNGIYWCVNVAMVGFLWGVNDGRLGTRQLAAGELWPDWLFYVSRRAK